MTIGALDHKGLHDFTLYLKHERTHWPQQASSEIQWPQNPAGPHGESFVVM
jgi:hypothetical protein